MISNHIHETLIAMGFEYEPAIEAYFYRQAEDYIEQNKLQADLLPFHPEIYKQEYMLKEAAIFIWQTSSELTNEYRTERFKELVEEITGLKLK